MWLRPGLAQEWLEMANRIRAQSPDRYGSPGASNNNSPYDPLAQVPYDSVSRPPMQPVPVTRPVNWPGSSVESGANVAQPAAPPVNSATGVKVWDPSGRYAGLANTAPQSVPQNAVPSSPSQYPPQQPVATPSQTMPASTAPQQPWWQQLTPNQQPVSSVAPEAVPVVNPPAAGSVNYNPVIQPVNASAVPPAGTQLATVPDLGAQNLQVFPSQPKELPDAQVAAKIGSEAVLMGDLKAMVSDALFRNKMQIPAEQREKVQEQFCRMMLKQIIETKLIYNDALHTIPKEALPKIEGDLNGEFDKVVLPKLLESHEATTVQELDRKMRERGSSLEFMRRCNFEKNMSQGWLQQKIKFKEEVPLSDVLGYYKSHMADYEFPTKARWEELMVPFVSFPDKAAAWAAIAQMGTAVQQGQPFAEVAKTSSQGLTASEGGQWDWTTKDSLASKQIDQAVFGLPVGTLSQIIETERGFHIVRVAERIEAGRKSFMEMQPEIKKQLKQERIQKQIDNYLSDIRQKTPIWTMYDDQPGGLEGVQQERRSVFE